MTDQNVASQYYQPNNMDRSSLSDDNKKPGTSACASESGISYGSSKSPFYRRFIDSFKPAIYQEVDTTGMTEEEIQNARMASTPLAHTMPAFTLSLMAIGGSIGSGLFVGSGSSYSTGGPAGVILGFGITGIMLYFMMYAAGEQAVRFNVSGSYTSISIRLIDDSIGVASGWCYCLLWLMSFPLELNAAAIVLGFWKDDNNGATNVNPAAWVALFWAVLTIIGFSGARIYAASEAVLSIIKIITIIGFCIFGICATAGANPHHHYFGAHYWHDPGAFNNGFKGFATSFTNAAFACSGVELAVLASSESKDSHKSLPRIVKQTFWRIILFFIVSLTICFCLVPYTNPQLGSSQDGSASPFVLAIEAAGVHGLPSVMNVVILLAALSVGNASVYACSRTLAALAQQGGAPRFVAYYDRAGRPLVSIIITCLIGLIGFISASGKAGEAFDWLLAISSQATLYTWGSINLNHVMLRIAMKKQGRSLDEQYFASPFGIWGSLLSLAIILWILGLQFWTALWPVGGSPDAASFFQTWLSLPIVLAIFFVHKLYYRRPFPKPSEVDLVTGARLRTKEERELFEIQKEQLVQKSWWKRWAINFHNLFF
nr:Gap1.1 [Starmerella bombicola]